MIFSFLFLATSVIEVCISFLDQLKLKKTKYMKYFKLLKRFLIRILITYINVLSLEEDSCEIHSLLCSFRFILISLHNFECLFIIKGNFNLLANELLSEELSRFKSERLIRALICTNLRSTHMCQEKSSDALGFNWGNCKGISWVDFFDKTNKLNVLKFQVFIFLFLLSLLLLCWHFRCY